MNDSANTRKEKIKIEIIKGGVHTLANSDNHLITIKHLQQLAEELVNKLKHETWTLVLDDENDTEINKEVVTWTSAQ